MTPFQIISIIISLFALAGGIITVYIKMKTDVAKLQVEMLELRNLITINDKKTETIRKENRDDHKKMFDKIDKVLQNQLEFKKSQL